MICDRPLTWRQKEVLALVGEHKKNHEIAEILGVTEYTINNALTKIFRQLHVHKREEAFKKFLEQEENHGFRK
jgi:DNA-binding CsgD family transcriptional regulator